MAGLPTERSPANRTLRPLLRTPRQTRALVRTSLWAPPTRLKLLEATPSGQSSHLGRYAAVPPSREARQLTERKHVDLQLSWRPSALSPARPFPTSSSWLATTLLSSLTSIHGLATPRATPSSKSAPSCARPAGTWRFRCCTGSLALIPRRRRRLSARGGARASSGRGMSSLSEVSGRTAEE